MDATGRVTIKMCQRTELAGDRSSSYGRWTPGTLLKNKEEMADHIAELKHEII